MDIFIYFLAVLTVASCADDAGSGTKYCVQTWKYNAYMAKKTCLKSYMGSVIRASSTPTRRKRDVIPAAATAISITNSTLTLPSTLPAPESTTNITNSTPTPDPFPTSITNCSSLDEVKGLFEEKWAYFVNKSSYNVSASNDFKNGNRIRKEIFEKVLQEKRLKEFKPVDFACLRRKDVKEDIKTKCVIGVLKKFANVSKIPVRISNVLSKPSKIKVDKTPCKNYHHVASCAKNILKKCSSTVQKFVADIDGMMNKTCERYLNTKPPGTTKTGTIIISVVLAICGVTMAGFGIYKFLKMRRNRGLHTVTRSPPDECEMTSRVRPKAL